MRFLNYHLISGQTDGLVVSCIIRGKCHRDRIRSHAQNRSSGRVVTQSPIHWRRCIQLSRTQRCAVGQVRKAIPGNSRCSLAHCHLIRQHLTRDKVCIGCCKGRLQDVSSDIEDRPAARVVRKGSGNAACGVELSARQRSSVNQRGRRIW